VSGVHTDWITVPRVAQYVSHHVAMSLQLEIASSRTSLGSGAESVFDCMRGRSHRTAGEVEKRLKEWHDSIWRRSVYNALIVRGVLHVRWWTQGFRVIAPRLRSV
jgi:hypothetical protein